MKQKRFAQMSEEERAEATSHCLDVNAEAIASMTRKEIKGVVDSITLPEGLGDRIRISLHADADTRRAMRRLRDLLSEMLDEWPV